MKLIISKQKYEVSKLVALKGFGSAPTSYQGPPVAFVLFIVATILNVFNCDMLGSVIVS